MIAVVATLTVNEGKGEEFEAAAKEMVAAVARAEAGKTLMYTLHRAPDRPNTYLFYEQYADDDALAAHRTTAHMAAFGARLRGVVAGRAEIQMLESVASLEG